MKHVQEFVARCHGRVYQAWTAVILISLEALLDEMYDWVDIAGKSKDIVGDRELARLKDESAVEGYCCGSMSAILRWNVGEFWHCGWFWGKTFRGPRRLAQAAAATWTLWYSHKHRIGCAEYRDLTIGQY